MSMLTSSTLITEAKANNFFYKFHKSQIRKFLSSFCCRESANFVGVPVRKSQIKNFITNLKFPNPQIASKYRTTLSQNDAKSRLCKPFFVYKFELEHFVLCL
jgi:hypothetical protein